MLRRLLRELRPTRISFILAVAIAEGIIAFENYTGVRVLLFEIAAVVCAAAIVVGTLHLLICYLRIRKRQKAAK